jgi:hypothetical protein
LRQPSNKKPPAETGGLFTGERITSAGERELLLLAALPGLLVLLIGFLIWLLVLLVRLLLATLAALLVLTTLILIILGHRYLPLCVKRWLNEITQPTHFS